MAKASSAHERPPPRPTEPPGHAATVPAAILPAVPARWGLLALAPVFFRTGGEGEEVVLFDDGDPSCKQVRIDNPRSRPLRVRVTWKGDEGDVVEEHAVAPDGSLLLSCAMRRLAVVGPDGQQGSWEELDPAKAHRVRLKGSGYLYRTQPGSAWECRAFRISNRGRKPVTVKVVRERNGADETLELRILPGNETVVRCRIVSIRVEGDPDADIELESVPE